MESKIKNPKLMILQEIESFFEQQIAYCEWQEKALYDANSKKTEGDEFTEDVNLIRTLKASLLQDQSLFRQQQESWRKRSNHVSVGSLIELRTPEGRKMMIFISCLKHTPQLKLEGTSICFTGVKAPLIQSLLKKTEGEAYEFKNKKGIIKKID